MTQPFPCGTSFLSLLLWSWAAVADGEAEGAEGSLSQSTPLLLVATPVDVHANSVDCRKCLIVAQRTTMKHLGHSNIV